MAHMSGVEHLGWAGLSRVRGPEVVSVIKEQLRTPRTPQSSAQVHTSTVYS